MTATDAAIEAGYESKYAATHSTRWLKMANIQERLGELNKPVIARVQRTKDAKLQVLEKIYTHEPDPETITAQVVTKAISEHNKMEGDYAPEKHAVLGDIEITIVHRDKS